MRTYQFPAGRGVVFEVKATSLEEAMERARVRLNTTKPPEPIILD
jgi:hypothetical protein